MLEWCCIRQVTQLWGIRRVDKRKRITGRYLHETSNTNTYINITYVRVLKNNDISK